MTRIGIAVGSRGRGSNMIALVDALRPMAGVELVVIAENGEAPAAIAARERGVELRTGRLAECVEGLDYLLLAGYLRLVDPETIRRFPERLFNIHPALLPDFGGAGMYGLHVHRAVLAFGATESGCTVHVVSEKYDEGRILSQARCPVLPGDSPESLAARVLRLEHKLYPATVIHELQRPPA